MAARRSRKSKPRKRFIVVWWMSGTPYALTIYKQDLVDAFCIVRNALKIEVLSDGRIGAIFDWYWRDDAGKPEPARWHEQQSSSKRWNHRYLVIWWQQGHAHAMLFHDSSIAHEFSAKTSGVLFEIFKRGGRIGEAVDYKFFDKDEKPTAFDWKDINSYMGGVVPWRGQLSLAVGPGGRWPRV